MKVMGDTKEMRDLWEVKAETLTKAKKIASLLYYMVYI